MQSPNTGQQKCKFSYNVIVKGEKFVPACACKRSSKGGFDPIFFRGQLFSKTECIETEVANAIAWACQAKENTAKIYIQRNKECYEQCANGLGRMGYEIRFEGGFLIVSWGNAEDC